MGYISMCGPKGQGFSAVLVINRVWFQHSSMELGMFNTRSYFFIIINKTENKSPSKLMFRATVPAATIINRVSNFRPGHKQSSKKSQILVINRVRVLGSGPHTPTQLFWSTPPGFHSIMLIALGWYAFMQRSCVRELKTLKWLCASKIRFVSIWSVPAFSYNQNKQTRHEITQSHCS